jgi:hypothetical protein
MQQDGEAFCRGSYRQTTSIFKRKCLGAYQSFVTQGMLNEGRLKKCTRGL